MLTFSITLFVNRIPVEGILLYSLAVLSTCIPACSLLNILSQKRVNSHFIPCDDEWYIFVQQTNSKHSSKQLCWLFDPWNCFYIKLSKLPPHILNMIVFLHWLLSWPLRSIWKVSKSVEPQSKFDHTLLVCKSKYLGKGISAS